MTRTTTNRSSEKTTLAEFGLIVGVAAAIAFGMSFWMRSADPARGKLGGLPVGATAPSIEAPHWVNGEPSGDGRIRVVHAWFAGCRFCWQEAPELVALQAKYGDRVEFIGLAQESGESREAVTDFVTRNGITWANGFGEPYSSLRSFDVKGYPSVWVLDESGTVVWSHDSEGSLEQGIQQALEN